MLWGACCREAIHIGFENKSTRYNRSITLGFATGMCAIFPIHSVYFGYIEWIPALIQDGIVSLIGITLFLFWTILSPCKINILSNIGRITYSMYLLHVIVILTIIQFIKNKGGEGHHLLLYITVSYLITLALGKICYHVIEVQSNNIGKVLSNQ